MRRIVLSLFAVLYCVITSGQALHIYHDGEKEPKVVANGGVLKITFEPKFMGSTEYQQVFYTLDGELRFDKVDSVRFNQPHFALYKHEYIVPNEYGELACYISTTENEWPVITNSAGEVCYDFAYHDENFPKRLLRNYSKGEAKDASYTLSLGNNKETFTIKYTGEPFCRNKRYNTIYIPKEGADYEIDTDLPLSYNGENATDIEFRYPDNGKPSIHIAPNNTAENRDFQNIKAGDLTITYGFGFSQLGTAFKHTQEEHMAALKDLYNNCNGEHWEYKENWWSDKPIWEWECINHDIYGSALWYMNHVGTMRFGDQNYNGLNGELPESFVVFLDDTKKIDMGHSALNGVIPYAIRHHDRWQELGWDIIQQNPVFGGGFDMDDINLHIDDVKVEDFVNDVKTTTYNELKKHKITWVFNGGMVDMINGISDERVNKYLDYKNKGLGLAVPVHGYGDIPYDNYKSWVVKRQNDQALPKEIMWTKGFDKANSRNLGDMYILDSDGNLLWYKKYIYPDYHDEDPEKYERMYIHEVDSVCRKYLGEPEEHDIYSSVAYESTDYSQDGVVMTLQKATVGKGIDLVLLGDEYVDTMMVAGGLYEEDMKKSMEYFFEAEPYKTLRDRFNVYTVKVVSKNGYEGDDHRIDYDNDVCFEYASKIPGIDLDNVTISVTFGNPNSTAFTEGQTQMYESGASVAYIEGGGPSFVIVHEAGGHGFAKLLDEYIYSGYEDNIIPTEDKEEFKNWLKTEYHDKGLGMNVAATDDPEQVPWAHFLKDNRYKDEVGIYKGAWLYPEDLWRASENSVMNANGEDFWFNAPSREAIYKRVMQLSEGESWTYDYETFVAFDQEVMNKAKARKARAKDVNEDRIFIEKSPVIIKDGVKSVPNKSAAKSQTRTKLPNIPANMKLVPIQDVKERTNNMRTICIGGMTYVITPREM